MKNHIRELRKKRKITQEELADSLKVTRQTINAIEQGKYFPSLELAFKIAGFFRKRIEEIFDYSESNKN